MTCFQILYFRGPLLEEVQEIAGDDVVAAAQTASSRHPSFTAEIWRANRKIAVVRPWGGRLKPNSGSDNKG